VCLSSSFILPSLSVEAIDAVSGSDGSGVGFDGSGLRVGAVPVAAFRQLPVSVFFVDGSGVGFDGSGLRSGAVPVAACRQLPVSVFFGAGVGFDGSGLPGFAGSDFRAGVTGTGRLDLRDVCIVHSVSLPVLMSVSASFNV